jgi:tetratricopeptide (TPR) repeat protein
MLILMFSFTRQVGLAETPEQFFDLANQAYQQGKFPDAIQKYEQILKTGVASGELYYNLGNAYYKSGNVSKAILNYERALKLMPTDDDLRHNLQLANLMITDKIEPAPRLFVWDWWDAIKSTVSLNTMTWIAYVLFVLVVGAIALAMLAPSYAKRRMAFFGGLVCTLCLIGSLVVFVGKLNQARSIDTAIVTANITTVKNSPDAKSSDAFVLHSGVKVFVTDKVNQWMKIRLADGKVGWMEQTAAEII